MKTTENTVLITGGATGIGLALAEAFLQAGNKVNICARRENKLQEAKESLPRLHIRKCDISDTGQAQALSDWAASNFPDLNILVNNAGVQRYIDFKNGLSDLLSGEDEIAINLKAPVCLTALFIPHLLKQKEAAIINISSGLAFAPLAIAPVYCATKVALHSFSLSLRHLLAETCIKVFEVAPPMVDTELDKGGRESRDQGDKGIRPREVADAALGGLKNDKFEIIVGMANALRSDPEKMFKMINR